MLIKLHHAGINGTVWKVLFYWIKDILNYRSVQVRVGLVFLETLDIENGAPQGSVINPVLFSIMINDTFQEVHQGFGEVFICTRRHHHPL